MRSVAYSFLNVAQRWENCCATTPPWLDELLRMPILSLQNVTKDYLSDGQRVRALDGLSLEVSGGEFVALVGRSGCGVNRRC